MKIIIQGVKLKNKYFITGIDTSIGKSVATGVLAREWNAAGSSIITQKLVQTGCSGISEDILTHRRIMGVELLPEDLDGTTCPLVFRYPASPHLAAAMESREVDIALVEQCTERLLQKYSTVLIEGAGGVHVPLKKGVSTIDYICENSLPVIAVTSPRLGSLNHTILTLEALASRGIELSMLIYNLYPDTSEIITGDTRNYLLDYLRANHPQAIFAEINEKSEFKQLPL